MRDCYEGTACLINKFGVKDEKVLSVLEADITFAKSAQLEFEPVKGEFDIVHYKAIHKFLFEDLYDWAGEFRRINLSKKEHGLLTAINLTKQVHVCFQE